jgi:glycine/D-amino acid oxidase-like deaminating enzyme
MDWKSTADVVVIGGGLMGCSIACNLADLGAENVVVLERGELASGGTGKSCAIVRTHYSIRANLMHAVESLRILENMQEHFGGDSGFRRTGYLIVGPEEQRKTMESVFRMQNEQGIETAVLTPAEATALHPFVHCDAADVLGYDAAAGYCDPHLTTMSFARRAIDLGVTIHMNSPVTSIRANGRYEIETARGRLETETVVLAAGPWTAEIAEQLGIALAYQPTLHRVVTLQGEQPYPVDLPILKDLHSSSKIYVRPASHGEALVGTGDMGVPVGVDDPVPEQDDHEHVAELAPQVDRLMPAFANARLSQSWTGLYDVTPDWSPLVGPIDGLDHCFVAVGFSGHGFKLAPTIGQALASVIVGREPAVPIDAYAVSRFAEGGALVGAYGEGAIA